MKKTPIGKLSCAVTLVALTLIQIGHYVYFSEGVELLEFRFYGVLLAIIPPAFFFFGREVLFENVSYKWYEVFHFSSIFLSLILPVHVLPAMSFIFGSFYTIWFTQSIYRLRHESKRFKFELFFFGLFALMAIAALILGFALPWIGGEAFYLLYSNSISIAVLLIVAALLAFPALLGDILLIAELAYATTKLHGVDTTRAKDKLESLMTQEKLYENEALNLSMVANQIELSPHQLSELINTEYGFSFPRYIRDHRIQAAKELLLADSNVSILSISMETGFKSQSNFYTAFKDATGMSPGQFRRQ